MKEKKLEIDSIRVYQSVKFERKQYTFFSTKSFIDQINPNIIYCPKGAIV